ncbi:MAG: methyl-accepting chemotaxis protein [Spirochaetales bacterium]|nr:methyl-accepting chemotaxis protein [Spirochaetales bacterium]
MKFKAYEQESYVVKEKVRNTFLTLMILGTAFLLGTVSNSFGGNFKFVIINLFLLLLVVGNVVALMKGFYTNVVYVLIFCMFIMVYSLNFIDVKPTPYTIWKLVTYNISALLLTAVFAESRKYLIITSMGVIVFYLLAVVQKSGVPDLDRNTFIFASIYSGLIQVLGIGLVINIFDNFKKHLDAAQKAQKISEERLIQMQALMESSRDGFSIGESLLSTTAESRRDIKDMLLELETMGEEINSLEVECKNSDKSYQNIEISEGQVRNRMEKQTEVVNDSSRSIEKRAAHIKELALSAQEKSSLLKDLVSTSQKGLSFINEVREVLKEVQKSTDEVVNAIMVIEDIASRTSLLGMNASIEAAHAGKEGRGFSIVAEEIRKLAEETNTNSNQIRAIMATNSQLSEHFSSLNKETETLFQGIHGQIEQVEASMTEIFIGLEDIHKEESLVLAGVGELKDVNLTVNRSLQEMKSTTLDGRSSLERVIHHSTELITIVDDIRNKAQKIDGTIEEISLTGRENKENIDKLQERIKDMK